MSILVILRDWGLGRRRSRVHPMQEGGITIDMSLLRLLERDQIWLRLLVIVDVVSLKLFYR